MRRLPAYLSLLVVVLVACIVPSTAGAATWASQAEVCGGFNTSERGSGQMDALGRLYVPCSLNDAGQHSNYIVVFNAAGARIQTIPLRFALPGNPTGTDRASDVAPSPDGSYLYVIHYASYVTYRFNRQADGSYVVDPAWRLADYPDRFGGAAHPLGQFLATDAGGAIYFSSGLWACNVGCTDDAIVKYDADGRYVTRFGEKSGGSWALGQSHGSFGGVSVTADGRRVFAVDINNSRVQRFDRQGDGSYRALLAMGMDQNVDPNRWGGCNFDQPGALPQALAAPYDVAMSAGGELLVINTTCFATADFHQYMPYGSIEVRRFGQDGSVRGTIVSTSKGDTRVHGIAVDRAGNIHLPQAKAVLRPAAGWSDAGADAAGGGPMGGTATSDVTAPVVTSFAGPATTTTRTVTLTLGATDASGIAGIRIREDGVQGGWQAYATSLTYTLADGAGAHVLELEARDPIGNVSSARGISITLVVPQPTSPTPGNPTPGGNGTPATPGGGAAGGGGAVVDGGGGVVNVVRPRITRTTIPVQVFRGRRFAARVTANGEQPVTSVRFATAGRWSAWQPIAGAHPVTLPAGVGWKGVLVQVRDAAGTRSVPWFQPVLMGPRGTRWVKGTSGVNDVRGTRASEHVDLSSFDSKVDHVSCGGGYDTVYAQPEDVVARDCERVVRVVVPTF